ncbi:MAG: bifunctional 4-hydroxy-2-oxoglutarate aldolase/2-dehydro-3-deoxy-phosphogluconate aldolase [Ferruginibacter sp.]
MDRKKKIVNLVIGQGILPLYFHRDADISLQILRALYDGGIRVVEYANLGETAIDNFLRLRKVASQELPGLYLGAGMVRNKIEATEFINEGADFIICPGVTESVASLAENNGLLWVPCCLTSTEVVLADDMGAQLVKLFPGSLLGPAYLAAIKEIFPNLLFMPAGGVETGEENLNAWFKSGASAVGLDLKLISNNLIETKDYAGIESSARQTMEAVQKIRKS